VLRPGEIVDTIEKRVRAHENAILRLLDGAELTPELDQALTPFESLTLGASTVDVAEGAKRIQAWLMAQPNKALQPTTRANRVAQTPRSRAARG
jgi:hypothetical protein